MSDPLWRRVLPPLTLAAAGSLALTGCGDDGYDAPDRTISFADVIDVPNVRLELSLPPRYYVEAAEVLLEASALDPQDPTTYLDEFGRPDRNRTRLIVQCAWAAALAEGEAGVEPDAILEAVLEDGPGGCADLTVNEFSLTATYLPPPGSDGPQGRRYAEALLIERAMYEYLAPEIAEAVADRG